MKRRTPPRKGALTRRRKPTLPPGELPLPRPTAALPRVKAALPRGRGDPTLTHIPFDVERARTRTFSQAAVSPPNRSTPKPSPGEWSHPKPFEVRSFDPETLRGPRGRAGRDHDPLEIRNPKSWQFPPKNFLGFAARKTRAAQRTSRPRRRLERDTSNAAARRPSTSSRTTSCATTNVTARGRRHDDPPRSTGTATGRSSRGPPRHGGAPTTASSSSSTSHSRARSPLIGR